VYNLSEIITSNINEEFSRIKRGAVVNRNNGGYGIRSAIVDKGDLPKRVQRKMASASSTDIKMGSSTFYHPLFQTTNMMLPRDRRERNEWCRHFYRTEPIIATSLDLHTEFPISDFNNVCSDTEVKRFFDYMAFDKLDMINLLLDIGLEYWKLGDVFPFGQLNESEGMWERFVILNPDYVDIQGSILAEEPIIELIPDQTVVSIVNGGPRGEFAEIYSQLPEDVIRQIKMGRNIRLDNRLVSHIAHKASQYETWGTPIMMRCFKTLIYKDKLRGAQDAIANRHIMPLRVAKIGAPGEPMPSQADIDNFRDVLLQADDDPNFFLVYHYGLSFDYVGSSGKILPLNQEFDFIQKELMNGLGINQAMLNGEGPTYANAQVGFDTLARRYMSYRLRLEQWIKHKVYRPIAEIQGFYKSVNGEINSKFMSEKQRKISAARKDMQLMVPDIAWQQQDLTGNSTVLNFIQQLQQKGLVSMTTILPMIGLDPEVEKKNLEKERGTVFDPNAPKTGPLPSEGGPLGTAPGGGPTGGTPKPPMPGDEDGEGGEGGEGKSKVPTPPPGGKPGNAPEAPTPKGPTPPTPPPTKGPGGKANPADFGFPGKGPTPPPATKQTNLQSFFVKDGETEASTLPRSSKSVKVRRLEEEN
jgi:hypothetical protein